MPQTCTICRHPERESIERGLLSGETFRHISARTGTSTAALQRHKNDHIPLTLAKGHCAEEVTRGGTLLEEIGFLRQRTMRILDRAEQQGDLRTALRAISEATKLADLMSKVRAETAEEDWPRADNLRAALQHVILMPKNVVPEIMAERTRAC